MTLGVINYGVGNLGSLIKSLKKLNIEHLVIDSPVGHGKIDRFILPGVGSFTECMKRLKNNGWIDFLDREILENGRPLLGICVGMQLLATSGEEGAALGGEFPISPGLGYIGGHVKHLRANGCSFSLPHIGWNSLENVALSCSILTGIQNGTDFYFVHSYSFIPNESSDISAIADYDINFVAVVNRGSIFGVQFHPEKSSLAGLKVIKNFATYTIC